MKLAVGFITYNDLTAKYLPYFLPSLFFSDYKDFTVLVADNSEVEDNENKKYIGKNYPQIRFEWMGENLGFSKAYNRLIRKAKSLGAEYFLMLNPDMLIEPEMITRLMAEMKNNHRVGAVMPKILRWDFEKKLAGKTNKVDSYGIKITEKQRFFDFKQGQEDDPGLSKHAIFGFTGAAALLRISALDDIAYQGKEYFDELFFMYKEDCDISYRLNLAGWDIFLVPEGVCYHDRTVAAIGKNNLTIALNRKKKSANVRRWSFLNQWILFLKYRRLPYKPSIRLKIIWYHFKSLVYIVFFEPVLIEQVFKLFKIWPEIRKRKAELKIRVELKKIEEFMQKKYDQ